MIQKLKLSLSPKYDENGNCYYDIVIPPLGPPPPPPTPPSCVNAYSYLLDYSIDGSSSTMSPAEVLDIALDQVLIIPISADIVCCPFCGPYLLSSLDTYLDFVESSGLSLLQTNDCCGNTYGQEGVITPYNCGSQGNGFSEELQSLLELFPNPSDIDNIQDKGIVEYGSLNPNSTSNISDLKVLIQGLFNHPNNTSSLLEILDRILDKGLVVSCFNGNVVIGSAESWIGYWLNNESPDFTNSNSEINNEYSGLGIPYYEPINATLSCDIIPPNACLLDVFTFLLNESNSTTNPYQQFIQRLDKGVIFPKSILCCPDCGPYAISSVETFGKFYEAIAGCTELCCLSFTGGAESLLTLNEILDAFLTPEEKDEIYPCGNDFLQKIDSLLSEMNSNPSKTYNTNYFLGEGIVEYGLLNSDSSSSINKLRDLLFSINTTQTEDVIFKQVLDKGIVVYCTEYWTVIASIETFLKYAEATGITGCGVAPPVG